MRPTFNHEFKQAAVQRLLARGDRTRDEICTEIGISHASASRWISQFGSLPSMNKFEVKRVKQIQAWTAEEKLAAVLEYRRLKDDPTAQGEYLRREGLYGVSVELWEREILGALGKVAMKPKRSAEEIAKDQKIVALERDLLRKDRALAETTALLVLKKKAESIWGLVDDEESA